MVSAVKAQISSCDSLHDSVQRRLYIAIHDTAPGLDDISTELWDELEFEVEDDLCSKLLVCFNNYILSIFYFYTKTFYELLN